MKSLGRNSGKKPGDASSAPPAPEVKRADEALGSASAISSADSGGAAVREAYGGMNGFLRRSKAERDAEVAALGTGRGVDPAYKGSGQGKDMRLMSEDPRLGYQVHRPEDGMGLADSAAHAAKAAPGKAVDKAKESLTTSSGLAELGKDTASTAVNFIPFVGAARSTATVKKEHGRKERDEEIAADEKADPLTRGVAAGLAAGHRATMARETIGGAASLIPLPGAGAVVGAVGGEASDAILLDSASKARRDARLPERKADESEAAHRARVDAANDNLPALAAADPTYAKKTLAYLEPKPLSRTEEIAAARKQQKLEEKVTSRSTTDAHLFRKDEAVTERLDPATGELKETSRRPIDRPTAEGTAVEQHTLKPSAVAAFGRMERARVAQRERMGAGADWDKASAEQKRDEDAAAAAPSAPNRLEHLLENEEKSFYENR
jgi:hypothetical protein